MGGLALSDIVLKGLQLCLDSVRLYLPGSTHFGLRLEAVSPLRPFGAAGTIAGLADFTHTLLQDRTDCRSLSPPHFIGASKKAAGGTFEFCLESSLARSQ